MILVADIGNTNTKIGVFENNLLKESFRISNASFKTSDEYGFYLKNIFTNAGIDISKIDGGIMGSVNPNLNYTFEHMLKFYFGFTPIIVGSGIKTGINVKYSNPKEVGADRIMGCVAAYNLYGAPCLVIDCGTATTFNVVNASGDFEGGAIGFGLKTSADALSTSTAKLPNVELTTPPAVVCKSTISCMQSGVIYGYVSMIEGMIKRIKDERGEMKVIATGGLSQIVSSVSNVFDVVDRTLTLKGLNIVYTLNCEE